MWKTKSPGGFGLIAKTIQIKGFRYAANQFSNLDHKWTISNWINSGNLAFCNKENERSEILQLQLQAWPLYFFFSLLLRIMPVYCYEEYESKYQPRADCRMIMKPRIEGGKGIYKCHVWWQFSDHLSLPGEAIPLRQYGQLIGHKGNLRDEAIIAYLSVWSVCLLSASTDCLPSLM